MPTKELSFIEKGHFQTFFGHSAGISKRARFLAAKTPKSVYEMGPKKVAGSYWQRIYPATTAEQPKNWTGLPKQKNLSSSEHKMFKGGVKAETIWNQKKFQPFLGLKIGISDCFILRSFL